MKNCDICFKNSKIQYRVQSYRTINWIFVCKNCWKDFSKDKNYIYGGTRKSN